MKIQSDQTLINTVDSDVYDLYARYISEKKEELLFEGIYGLTDEDEEEILTRVFEEKKESNIISVSKLIACRCPNESQATDLKAKLKEYRSTQNIIFADVKTMRIKDIEKIECSVIDNTSSIPTLCFSVAALAPLEGIIGNADSLPEDLLPIQHPRGDEMDEDEAKDLAVDLVNITQQFLYKGPLNNRKYLAEDVKQREKNILASYNRLQKIFADGMDNNFQDVIDMDQFDHNSPCPAFMKALALKLMTSTAEGAGVCEDFGVMALGQFTTIAPPQSEACLIHWAGDHFYVIVRVRSSRWWVVDPWCPQSVVTPWANNGKERKNTCATTHIRLLQKVDCPFGIPLIEDKIYVELRDKALAIYNDEGNVQSLGQRDWETKTNVLYPSSESVTILYGEGISSGNTSEDEL